MRKEEKTYRETVVGVALALSLVLGWLSPVVHAVVLVETAAETGADQVLLATRGGAGCLVDPRTGEPTDAPSLDDVVTSSGGLLRWVVTRDDTDQLGFRHVFYQQHYVPSAYLPPGVATWTPDGFQLAGVTSVCTMMPAGGSTPSLARASEISPA